MNDQKPLGDLPETELEVSSQPVFSKLYTLGVVGWVVGAVIIFGLAWPLGKVDSVSNAVLWAVTHWWMAFAFGLLLLIGYGLVSRLSITRATFAYVLPVGLLIGTASLCLMIYPDGGFRVDLFTFLPLVLLFNVFGILWIALRKSDAEASSFMRAVIPTVVGGLVILGFVAVPVFGSDEFRYRDAFRFLISKTAILDGRIQCEGTIEILKPGDYEFTTPRYIWADLAMNNDPGSGIDIGTITWGGKGAPSAGAVGVFPLQIAWRKGVVLESFTELPEYENTVDIEVHNRGEDNKLIYSISTTMDKR
jgi:hypothetical protein